MKWLFDSIEKLNKEYEALEIIQKRLDIKQYQIIKQNILEELFKTLDSQRYKIEYYWKEIKDLSK